MPPRNKKTSEISSLAVPAPPESSWFHFNIYSDRNFPVRRSMEDAHSFDYDFGGVEGQGYFGIFDGHGGKTASKAASSLMPEVLKDKLSTDSERQINEVMKDAFMEVDSHLTGDNGIHSGCTAVVCLLRPEGDSKVLYTANAGDARAVLFRSGKAIRLSYDHKATDPLEQLRIRASGSFITNQRVNGILAVTRSLGDQEMKESVIGLPYTTRTVIDEGTDTILILACDGVWDVLEEQKVCELADEHKDPLDAAIKITEQAILDGSMDNISVIVVYLQRRDKDNKE